MAAARTEDRARGIEMAPTIEYGAGGRAATEPDVEWIVERRPVDRVHRRARAHQRGGAPAAQALRGRRAPPLARHRGVVDGQRAAPREPARPRALADGGRRARDVPGQAAARRRRDPPDRPQPARPARAHRPGPRLPRRPHRARAHGLLLAREPGHPARDRAARDGRGRGRRGAAQRRRAHARSSGCSSRSAGAPSRAAG